MCTPLAVAQGVLGGTSAIMSARAQQEAAGSQATAAIRSMNYSFQGYEQQRNDAFDKAVEKISDIRMKSNTATGSVNAAVNESMSGRTAGALQRSVQGQGLRAISSEKAGYDIKSNEIDLNKERTLINTKNTLSSIKAPSPFETILNVSSVAVSAYTTGMESRTNETLLGIAKGKKGKNG